MFHIEREKQYEWSKKGKKYKTKYFSALGELYKEAQNDTDCQKDPIREAGANTLCDVAGQKRV